MKNLPKKIRSKKLSTRVDLTAMVSISFLLIIFFMVVGELSKPKMLNIGEDYGCGIPPDFSEFEERRVLTILLDDNDEIITYFGTFYSPIKNAKKVGYGKNGIRKEISEKNMKVLKYYATIGKPGYGISVIIKPSKKSNYGNFINILDEMEINNISDYSIINEYTQEESKLLASK
ncbi:biopolymer transporter ExbD [Flavobacterium sp. IR1]|nr:biopolymer transporter ExbD [Flavobacterium sp. IR1]